MEKEEMSELTLENKILANMVKDMHWQFCASNQKNDSLKIELCYSAARKVLNGECCLIDALAALEKELESL
jgi:hypothetical protein